MRLSTSVSLLVVLLPSSASFTPSSSIAPPHTQQVLGRKKDDGSLILHPRATASSLSSSLRVSDQDDNTMCDAEQMMLEQGGLVAPKLSFRSSLPEERGKGGVHAKESIAALEIMARIPRGLIVSTCDSPSRAIAASAEAEECSWAADLTAATLAALFPDPADFSDDDDLAGRTAKQTWIAGWEGGGWGTDGADLGPPETDWGAKDTTGSLLATGSNNDKNVFAKFRFPCHPVVYRAGTGLALLTKADEQESLDALLLRGKSYRGMRDALSPLVQTPTDERKGSLRERRAWDVADLLSRVLSRATAVQLVTGDASPAFCIVPVHERLAHCHTKGENSKLVTSDDGDEVLLVATRDIAAGEAITRDYASAPRLDGDKSEGALRLLLQFGLPPSAW